MFFHIDENAYQKLNRYFDAIRRSLSPDGKDEIMSDIEGRIAELLSEKIKNDKQVVGMREIDDVITVMGEPEDYRIGEENDAKTGSFSSNYAQATGSTFEYYRTKKFYRDEENAIIGGVCAGLGHYFRIEALWIRIIFILLLVAFVATPGIVYLLLWMLIPPAVTTAEKLEMRGEPINISNIEKKVREEFAQVNERLKGVDYDKINSNLKNGADRVTSGARTVVKGVARVIGAIMVAITGIWLGGLLVALLITLFATTAVAPVWYPYIEAFNTSGSPIWLVCMAAFFVVAVPVLGFFLLGLRILIPHIKPINGYVTFIMIMLWIASIACCIYFGVNQSIQYRAEGKVTDRTELKLTKNDTLKVRFRYNNEFANDIYNHHSDITIEEDSLGNQILYSNDVRFYVMKAEGNKPYVQIDRVADANGKAEGRKIAQNIKYNFQVKGNELILDNYHISPLDAKFHDQKVQIYLYLPEGYMFKAGDGVTEYDDTDNDFFNLWFDNQNHVYQMGEKRVYCLDCINGDGEMEDAPWSEGENNIPAPPAMSENEMKQMNKEMLEQQAEEMKKQAEEMKKEAKNIASDIKENIKDNMKKP